jgi:methionine transaminase
MKTNMFTSKLPNTGYSAFSVLSKMAADFNAINLIQGFVESECPPGLIENVNRYIREGYNQYAPYEGILPLREIISEKVENSGSHKYDPLTEITITGGGNQAINTAVTAFVKENDEVIILEPAYDCYAPIVKLNGGVPVYVKLKEPDYSVDWNEVNLSVTSRTKMIIINTPHNPTGTILGEEDLNQLAKVVSGSKIIILCDEVFEHIVFDDFAHVSVSAREALKQRSIIISSFGKMFNTNGWLIGYCLAPENLMKEYRKIQQYQIFSVNAPIQYAIDDFMQETKDFSFISRPFKEQRELLKSLLAKSKFKLLPVQGTYFQLLDYSAISNEKDKAFATRLTTDFGVATVPLSAFYHDNINSNIIRICFAKSNKVLEQAAEKLCEISG